MHLQLLGNMLRRFDLLMISYMQVLNHLNSAARRLLGFRLLDRHVPYLNRILVHGVLIEAIACLSPVMIRVVVHIPWRASSGCLSCTWKVIALELASILRLWVRHSCIVINSLTILPIWLLRITACCTSWSIVWKWFGLLVLALELCLSSLMHSYWKATLVVAKPHPLNRSQDLHVLGNCIAWSSMRVSDDLKYIWCGICFEFFFKIWTELCCWDTLTVDMLL